MSGVAGGRRLARLAPVFLATAITAWLAFETVQARFRRDVARIVFNDNLELLEQVRRHAGAEHDSLEALLTLHPAPHPAAAIVISVNDNRLWYRLGDSVAFEARVATGSGKTLVRGPGGSRWKFDTPRGRLTVIGKDANPDWVPPDWHYVEEAARRGLRLTRLVRGRSIDAGDGTTITVAGNDVVRRFGNGRTVPFTVSSGKEIVVAGQMIIPPFGTNQRRYRGVLGTHRLILGDGYAIHGTNVPSSIGRSVSHGCVRLRNEDIARLWEMVAVGTPVYIY